MKINILRRNLLRVVSQGKWQALLIPKFFGQPE